MLRNSKRPLLTLAAMLLCVIAVGCTPDTDISSPDTIWAVNNGQDVWLFWNASLGASSYAVLRGTVPNADFQEIGVVEATAYVDSGLAADTTYFYQVVAINANGERSAPSAAVSGANDSLPDSLGVAFPDLSGNGNHAYIGGNPRWSTVETPDGIAYAVEFDNASNQYLHTLTRGHLDGATNVVMEIDLYYEADLWTGDWGIVGGPHIGTGSTSAGNVQFTWTRRSPDGIDFRFHVEGETLEQRISTVIPAGEFENSWVTLRAEFDNGQYSLFANDDLMSQGNRGQRLHALDLPFYISTTSSNYEVGARVFKGKVKHVKLQVDGKVVLEWDFSTLIQP